MSRRGLAALGVSVNANNIGIMSNANMTGTGSAIEFFLLYLCSENINPSAVEGKELYLAVPKELDKEKRINFSIKNGHKVKNY